MEEKSLSIAFSDSLKEESISFISDLAEVGIDDIMENGLLKDVPILSTAVSIYKIGTTIKERQNMKKLVVFLNEINNGIISEQKRLEYQQKIQSDTEFRNQEIEYLLILIDRSITYDKPRMLSKLYLAYLDGKIVWKEFAMYAEVVDRFLPGDLQELQKGAQYEVHYEKVSDSLLRLVSMGLVVEHSKGLHFENTCGSLALPDLQQKDYELTKFGSILIEILSDTEV